VHELTPDRLLTWADEYVRVWRAGGTEGLEDLFADDAVYLTEPYAQPVVGLAAIERFWREQSDDGEVWTADYEVVAASGDTGVLRAVVRYGEPLRQEYTDLWVVTLASDGRAVRFEEWPFWPGHGATPAGPG
jgi:ketosteroid isomerase-like protein